MLITEEYRSLNAQKHEQTKQYGTQGKHYAQKVRDILRATGMHTVLDYGCGKRTLERELGFAITNYDPAIPGLDHPPEPHDLVVCTDVLEHVEPECLDAVLDDLKRVTKELCLMTVSTRLAHKHLPDGRNTHLIVQPADWWLPQIMRRFTLKSFSELGDEEEFLVILKAKQVPQ